MVGLAINLASRLEGSAMSGQVMVTASTFEKVKTHTKVRGTRMINFKGMNDGVTVYDIGAVLIPTPMTLPDETPSAASLKKPVMVAVHAMQGKKMNSVPMRGILTRFSPTWACITVNKAIEIAREIRLELKDLVSGKPIFVYARVVSTDKQPNGVTHWVRISYFSPEVINAVY